MILPRLLSCVETLQPSFCMVLKQNTTRPTVLSEDLFSQCVMAFSSMHNLYRQPDFSEGHRATDEVQWRSQDIGKLC